MYSHGNCSRASVFSDHISNQPVNNYNREDIQFIIIRKLGVYVSPRAIVAVLVVGFGVTIITLHRQENKFSTTLTEEANQGENHLNSD